MPNLIESCVLTNHPAEYCAFSIAVLGFSPHNSPDCITLKAQLIKIRPKALNLYLRQSFITYLLIALCVVIFWAYSTNSPILPSYYELYLPANSHYNIWQYITSLFLHGSISHLLLNMLGLWMFGGILERHWGHIRFLIFYLLCGIGAGIIYNLINTYEFNQITPQLVQAGLSTSDLKLLLDQGLYSPEVSKNTEALLGTYYNLYNTPTVGASGALYGILVAYAFIFPNTKLVLIFLPYPIAAKYFVPILILLDMVLGITKSNVLDLNIAHFAHVGGAITGLILVFILGRRSPLKQYN